jgi:hypothetical protein
LQKKLLKYKQTIIQSLIIDQNDKGNIYKAYYAAKTPVKAAVHVFVVASLSNITLLGLFLFVSDRPKNPW